MSSPATETTRTWTSVEQDDAADKRTTCPLPLGPSTTVTSPARACRETLCKARSVSSDMAWRGRESRAWEPARREEVSAGRYLACLTLHLGQIDVHRRGRGRGSARTAYRPPRRSGSRSLGAVPWSSSFERSIAMNAARTRSLNACGKSARTVIGSVGIGSDFHSTT